MKLVLQLVLAALWATSVTAQAPTAASLWDLPGTTLASTPALETGAVAIFWNPAAVHGPRGLRVGTHVVETPETVGLGAVMLGLTHPLNSRFAIGLTFARVHVGDLVRTSDSPAAEAGEIPVYEQTAGVAIGGQVGPATFATLIRGHDARFDIVRETGLSVDLGVRVQPIPQLLVAGATRFLPVQTDGDAPARYYGAVQARILERPLWGSPASVVGRYALLVKNGGALEHTVGAGADFGSRLRIDASYVRESSFSDPAWRLVLALGIRTGRYDILAARGSGLGGVGANYRVGLEVDFKR